MGLIRQAIVTSHLVLQRIRELSKPTGSLYRVPSDQCTVALLHGCTQGPSGWDRVRDLLSGSGVPSVALDLDPADFDGTAALECASAIAQVLGDHDRVVLVGTSCAGIIIPVVTMLRPIDHLVFVCAGLPDIGRSATDQIFHDGLLHDDWLHYDGKPDSPEAAERFMFNDCDGDVLAWSLSTVRLFMPQPAYDEVTPLESWPDTPSTYLLGTKDQIISQKWARQPCRPDSEIRPLSCRQGHCPQNSRPEPVAEILTRIVRSQREKPGLPVDLPVRRCFRSSGRHDRRTAHGPVRVWRMLTGAGSWSRRCLLAFGGPGAERRSRSRRRSLFRTAPVDAAESS